MLQGMVPHCSCFTIPKVFWVPTSIRCQVIDSVNHHLNFKHAWGIVSNIVIRSEDYENHMHQPHTRILYACPAALHVAVHQVVGSIRNAQKVPARMRMRRWESWITETYIRSQIVYIWCSATCSCTGIRCSTFLNTRPCDLLCTRVFSIPPSIGWMSIKDEHGSNHLL